MGCTQRVGGRHGHAAVRVLSPTLNNWLTLAPPHFMGRSSYSRVVLVGCHMKKEKADVFEAAAAAYLLLQRPATQHQYVGIIADWRQFLGAKSPMRATDLDAARYAKMVGERKGYRGQVTKATVARKLSALKCLYDSLVEAGKVERNPITPILKNFRHAHTGDRRPTELLDFREVVRLMEAPSLTTREGQRDRAFFALLFGCALRVGEVSELRVGDVRANAAGDLYIHLAHTKNGHEVMQPCPPQFAEAIKTYAQTRREEGASATDFLLVLYYADGRPHKNQLNTTQLRRVFHRWVTDLRIPGRITPHSGRATAITLLLEMGLPHREVRKFSRHSSVAMVERYDKLRDTGAENVAAAVDYKKIIKP